MSSRPDESRPEESGRAGDGRSADALAHSTAADVTAYLLAGPATFGGIGWLVDRWLTTSFGVPVGVLVGFALSLYVVWVRYGRP